MAKEEIFQEVDQLKEVLHKSVKTIFAHPETGGKEIFSANYFRSELEKEGFDVNENLLLKELISFIELTIKDLPVQEKDIKN